jgi:hypothetical protein
MDVTPDHWLLAVAGRHWLPHAAIGQQCQSQLLYDWRFSANQFVLAPSPLRLMRFFLFATELLRSESLCNILSQERMCFYEDARPSSNVLAAHNSILLKILPSTKYTSTLSVQALKSRSCISYLPELQRKPSHSNGRMLDRRQVQAFYIFCVWLHLVMCC